LLEDASALGKYLRMAFASEFGFLLDDAIINGTGAGQPLGIMNAGSMVQISKETGQAAGTIVYENILKMWARLIPSAMSDAVWLVNGNCFPQLGQMSLAVGSGGSAVYVPAGGASAAPYGTLLGRPVIPIEQCQSVGTTGDIILANFRKGYLLGEKGGMQSDMSIHVRFIYDESVFRFVLRLDGQPMLRAAITPFKGSDTVSHFVRIETRS
jgi:HK97 family phage major capsid protein